MNRLAIVLYLKWTVPYYWKLRPTIQLSHQDSEEYPRWHDMMVKTVQLPIQRNN